MNRGCPDFRTTCRLSRRSLLQAGTAGFAGLNLPHLLRAAESAGRMRPRAKHVIFLHQFGGPSHIDTFDMKPDAPDGIRGEFKPIALGQPGLTVTEHLPRFAKVHRQVRPGPVGPPHDEEPQLGDLLQPDRPRPAARRHPAPRHPGALPGLRQHGRQAPAGRGPGDPDASSSFPHVLRDGSVTPGQTASFLGKAYDPFFIGQDPNRPDFRLPELSLPAEPAARTGSTTAAACCS